MAHDLFFGQNGDDFLLWKFFGRKRRGFFIDVGAFDGVHLSNSYAFELAGWRGICVEPVEEFYKLCRAARPRSTCLHCACVGDEDAGCVELSVEPLGLLSGLCVNEPDVRRRYAARGLDYSGLRRTSVRAATLNSILLEHAPSVARLDFLSVDVEGTELDVLQGLDLARHRPRVIVVEANDTQAAARLANYLVGEHGYHQGRVLGNNVFYADTARHAKRLRGMRGSCRLQQTPHPHGSAFTTRVPESVSLGETRLERARRRLGRVKAMLPWRRGASG